MLPSWLVLSFWIFAGSNVPDAHVYASIASEAIIANHVFAKVWIAEGVGYRTPLEIYSFSSCNTAVGIRGDGYEAAIVGSRTGPVMAFETKWLLNPTYVGFYVKVKIEIGER